MKKEVGVIHIVAVLISALAVLKIYGSLTGNSENLTLYTVGMFLIPVFVAIAMNKVLSSIYDLKWEDHGLGKKTGFAVGYIVFTGIAFLSINFMSLPSGILGTIKIEKLILLALSCLMTGTFEELVFRGMIQNMVLKITDKPMKAIVISSFIFGIVHILNLIAEPQIVVGTITQVIYTFSLGMVLGTIYMCRGKIIEVMILHGAFNFLGQFTAIFASGSPSNAPRADLTITAAIIQLVFMLPCILIAVKTYRKNMQNNG